MTSRRGRRPGIETRKVNLKVKKGTETGLGISSQKQVAKTVTQQLEVVHITEREHSWNASPNGPMPKKVQSGHCHTSQRAPFWKSSARLQRAAGAATNHKVPLKNRKM
jgi:hypothetical protein